jgi:adenine deaminase
VVEFLNKNKFRNLLRSADASIPCETVFTGGKVLSVFSGVLEDVTFAVTDGMIVGFGESYESNHVVDLKGKIVVPGLIDSHIHIESTLATPKEFSKAAIRHGITTVIMDPHEIGNVLGTKGLDFMLESSKNLPVTFQMMLPSCVPATIHETSGAILRAEDLAPYYEDHRVSGLAEMMDLTGVKTTRDDVLQKLMDAKKHRKTLDGHGAGLSDMDNNLYRVAGISTDHECTTVEEAKDRLSKGFYVHIREGSVAKNFDTLLPVVNKNNHHRFTFCTDDIYIDDLYENGSIDTMIRKAIASGLDPIDAIKMATLNPATCYHLQDLGAVAPGYQADFVVLKNLESFHIHSVYQKGHCVFQEEEVIFPYENHPLPALPRTVTLKKLTLEDLSMVSGTGILHVIEILSNSLLTNHLVLETPINQEVNIGPMADLAKLFVMERHGNHGNMGKGIVKGFKMKSGAVATTIAHDSHNLVALGVNDEDLLVAVRRIEEIGGGLVLVENKKILAELPLEIGGLMSSAPLEEITEKLHRVREMERMLFDELDFNPFLTLSFLTLPVIPTLKITDKGLFDTNQQTFITFDEEVQQ